MLLVEVGEVELWRIEGLQTGCAEHLGALTTILTTLPTGTRPFSGLRRPGMRRRIAP